MEYKDRISVVTVVYNAVDELEKTMQMVVGQSYTNIEYIVIDGGSKDGTIDLIQKYEKQISFWLSEPDKGIYDAMNKGLDKATGDWVIFMNAGDFFFSTDTVADVFAADADYTGYAVVYGDTEFRLKSSNHIVKALDSRPDRAMPFSHQAAFARKETAQKYRYNTKYKLAADLDFFYRLTKDGFIFRRVPVAVCSYDAQKGLSMERNSEVLRVREFIDMLIQNFGVSKDSPYLKKMLRKAYLKQFIRYFIPNSIWMGIRERKIKNERFR